MVICIRQGVFLPLVPLFFVLSEFLPRYNSPFTFESREKCRRDWTVLFSHHSNANVSSCPQLFLYPSSLGQKITSKKKSRCTRSYASSFRLAPPTPRSDSSSRKKLQPSICRRSLHSRRLFCARDLLLLLRLAICTFAQKGGANILREAHSMRRRRRQLLFLPPPPPPTSLRV